MWAFLVQTQTSDSESQKETLLLRSRVLGLSCRMMRSLALLEATTVPSPSGLKRGIVWGGRSAVHFWRWTSRGARGRGPCR